MALILNIETATEVCSVALSKNSGLVDIRENIEGKSHASLLTAFIEDMLKSNNISPNDIDAIAVSEGPGSYTGLRIGVSAAKGLCYGTGKPLIAVSTLQAMVVGILKQLPENEKEEYKEVWFCPMIDARRLEVYTAFLNNQGKFESEIVAEIINENSFTSLLNNRKIIFFGNGSDKCKDIIKSSNAIFISGFHSSAKDMIPLSQQEFENENFKDVAYFEPHYLKEFVATTPKKKVIT